MIIAHNQLYTAEDKKEQEEVKADTEIVIDHVEQYLTGRTKGYWKLKALQQTVQKYPKQTRYDALKAALQGPDNDAIQFYAQGLNIWPLYIQEIEAGEINNVQALLPLMATEHTVPEYRNQATTYAELPIDDCSGLVKVIESKLDDDQKIKLMDIIVNFYQPKKRTCESTCCIRCSFSCNQRRAAFVAYAWAQAGERCIERQLSHKLFTKIYRDGKAPVTLHAVKTLGKQRNFMLATELDQKRRSSNRVKLLAQFNSIQLPDEKNFVSSYYNDIARPVITNIKSESCWPWAQLCSKE